MSTIDERIVRMRFDNAQFEAGVSQTMTTLDKFKEKLKFKSAKDDFKNFQASIDSVNFQKMADGIEKLNKRFSALGEVGATVVREITKSALSAAKQLEQSTLGQIKSGGWRRASNIANAQFQIEGLGFKWDEIYGAIDYGVTDTAYGLDAAATAASQLAASGVDFKKTIETVNGKDITQMHKALRGISGVAAMTNSSYEDISRIFTTIAGQGRVMGDQLNQLAGRGMNAAATIATALNTTEENVRNMVSKGAIDFNTFAEIMDNAFGDHAKDANKTFNGALSNMKAALSRIGALFADPVINKANTFFIALTSKIKEIQKALAVSGGVAERWTAVFTKGVDVASALINSVDLSSIKSVINAIAEGLRAINDALDYVASKIPGFVKSTESTNDAIEATAETIKLAKEVISGKYGNGATRIAKLGSKYKEVQSIVDKVVAANWDWDKVNIKIADSASNAAEETTVALDNTVKRLKLANTFLHADTKTKEEMIRIGVFTDEADAKKALKELQQIEDAKSYLAVPAQYRTDEMKIAIGKYHAYVEAVKNSEKELDAIQQNNSRQRFLDNIKYAVVQLGAAFKNVGTVVIKIVSAIGKGISAAFNPLDSSAKVYSLSDAVLLLSERLAPSEELLGKVAIASYKVFSVFQEIVDAVFNVIASIGKVEEAYETYIDVIDESGEKVDSVLDHTSRKKSLNNIGRAVIKLGKVVKNVGTAIVKTVSAIGKGIIAAFRPMETTGQVYNLSDALADLSERLIPSEETLEKITTVSYALSTAINKVVTVIAGCIAKVVKWVANLGKAEDATGNVEEAIDDVGESIDGAGKTVKKASSFFDKLKEKLAEIVDYIKGAPARFAAFTEALSQNEGVIRLQEAYSNLKTTISELIKNAIAPATEKFKEFRDNGLDMGGGVNIDSSWIVTAIGWVADKIAWLLEQIPVWINKIGEIANSISSAGKSIYDTVKGFFSGLDVKGFWESVTSGVESIFSGDDDTSLLSRVREGFAKIFDGFVKIFEGTDWERVGNASKLLIGIAMLWKVYSGLNSLADLMSSAAGIVGEAQGVVEAVKGAITSFGGLFDTLGENASRLVATGQMLSLIAVIATLVFAIAYLGTLPRDDVAFGLSTVIFLAAVIIAIMKVMQGLAKVMPTGGSTTTRVGAGAQQGLVNIRATLGTLASMALLIISFGASFYLISKAFEILSTLENVGQAIWFGLGILVAIAVACVALVLGIKAATKDLNLAQVKNFQNSIEALSMFIAVIGVAMILIAVALKIASTANFDNGGADFLWIFMASIFGGMALMLKAMKGVKAGAILGASVMILAVTAALYAILGVLAILSLMKLSGAPMWEPILAICAILVALGGMMWLIGNGWSKVPNKGFKSMAGIMWSLVGVLIAIAAAVYIIGKAGDTETITVAFRGMVIMLLLIGAALLAMVQATKSMGSSSEDIQSFAMSFVVVAGALLLLGAAVMMMSEALNSGNIGWVILMFGGFIAILAGLAFLAAKFDFAETFLQIGKGMLYAGAAFLLLGAGIWLAADAMLKGAIALPLFSTGIGNLLGVIEDHWLGMLFVIGFLAAVTVLVWKLGAVIGPVVESIAEHVKNGAKAIGGVLKSGGEKLGNWIKGLSTKGKAILIGVISGFLGAIAAMTPETLKTIGGILIKVIAYLGSIVGILAEALVEFLINLLNGLADAIQLNSASIAAAIWNVIAALLSLVLELIRPFFAIFGKAGNKMIDDATNWLNESSADLVENAKAADDAKKKYRGLAEQLAAVTDAADEMNDASEETKKNGGIFSGIGFGKNGEDVSVAPEGFDVTKYFGGGNAMDADTIKNFMNNGGIDAGKSFGYGVKDGVNLSGMPSDLKNDYLSKFGEGNTDMYDYGVTDGSDYTAGLADGFDFNNIEGMEGMEALDADNMLSEYSNPDAFQTASEENVDGLITGIDNKQDDVKAKMQETNDVAVIRLRAAKPRYVESAKHLLGGFIQGLREKKDDVNSEAEKIANEVSDTTDRAFKISSPSRVFAEKGMYVMMGLARGMQQNQDLALGATEDFGNALIVSFGAPLEQIAAMVNGDIPIDPTVRPVMDMSSVGSSASSINSMFSNQNVTLSGLSGQIAADIGTLDQSNTAIIEELQNMRDDLNYMTEQINGMQVVMDSGALVGQIATPIDRSLGRRAIFKGRGN